MEAHEKLRDELKKANVTVEPGLGTREFVTLWHVLNNSVPFQLLAPIDRRRCVKMLLSVVHEEARKAVESIALEHFEGTELDAPMSKHALHFLAAALEANVRMNDVKPSGRPLEFLADLQVVAATLSPENPDERASEAIEWRRRQRGSLFCD